MPIEAIESLPAGQTIAGFKAFTDAASAVPLSQTTDALAHQNRSSILAENLLGKSGKNLNQVDVVEAASSKQMLTGHEGMDQAGVAAMAQALIKGAQTIPPATSPSPVV